MAVAIEMDIDTNHEPSDSQKKVLAVFKYEISQRGESRMSPSLIRERMSDMGMDTPSKQNINYSLRRLVEVGWVRKLADGLYEFNEDPREDRP